MHRDDDISIKRSRLLPSISSLTRGPGSIGGRRRGLGRRMTARFDPNAVDGDGDGLVQEDTNFERPVTPHSLPKNSASESRRRLLPFKELDLFSTNNPAPPPEPPRTASAEDGPRRPSLLETMMRLAREEGGFTINRATEEKEYEGISVALKGTNKWISLEGIIDDNDNIIDEEKFKQELASWITENQEAFASGNITHYGGWLHVDGTKRHLVLDGATVREADDLDGSIATAREQDQIAIWDIETAEELRDAGVPDDIFGAANIPTGGTDGGQVKPVHEPDPTKIRLSPNGSPLIDRSGYQVGIDPPAGKELNMDEVLENLQYYKIDDLQTMFNEAWKKALANPSPVNVQELLAYRNALFQRGVVPYYGLPSVEEQYFALAPSARMTSTQQRKFMRAQADKLHRQVAQMIILSRRGKKQLSEPLLAFMETQVKSVDLEARRLLPDPLAVPGLHLIHNQQTAGILGIYGQIEDGEPAAPPIACRTVLGEPSGSLATLRESLFNGDPALIAVKAFAIAAESDFIKSGLVGFRSQSGRNLNALASYVTPGDMSAIRSPGRSLVASAVTPGGGGVGPRVPGGGIGGGGIGRQIGQTAAQAVRCPTGYQFGGRFSNRQLANCGQQLFDTPGNVEEPGGTPGAVAQRIVRTLTGKPRGVGRAGLVGVGFIKPGERGEIDATITRMAQVAPVGKPDTGRAATTVAAGIRSVASSNSGVSRLVRRDGVALDARVPVARLAQQRNNRDLIDGTFITPVTNPSKIGNDEIGLFGAGIASLRLVAPGGQEIRIDRSGSISRADANMLSRQWTTVRRGLNGEDGTLGLQRLAEQSRGKLRYSETFNNIDRPNDMVEISRNGSTKKVPRWVYETFYAANAPGRSEQDEAWTLGKVVASAGTGDASPDGIDTVAEAIDRIDNGGTLADIPTSLRDEALSKAKTVDTEDIGFGRSMLTTKGGQSFVRSEQSATDAFGQKLTADLQKALGVESPDVLLGKNGKTRSVFSATTDGVVDPKAALDRTSLADLAKIALADFVLGRTDRNPGSIAVIKKGNDLTPVPLAGGSSEFMQGGKLSSQKLAAAISREPEELLARPESGAWIKGFATDPSVAVQKILIENLDKMVARIGEFDWKSYIARISADGDLSIADKQHIEYMRRIMDVRSKRLQSSRKTILRLMGAGE